MKAPPAARRRWSVRVATVAGIDVRLHVTLLALAWLVFVASTEESTGPISAIVWLLLLFGSVLLHELAHSLTAHRVGVGVSEIELLPIGGISKMDRIPDRPRDEVAIAVAGPATSLLLGLASLGVALAAGASVWPPDLYGDAVVPRLGWLNLVLAAFNLIPALPLDGGRVLRAAVEPKVGPTEATHIAARAGRYFAFALIAAGALFNLWLLIIGVFVYVTSGAEDAGASIHAQLGRMTAADVMVRTALVLPARLPLSAARHLLITTTQRQFAVVDDEHRRYQGILDLDDDVPDGPMLVHDVVVPVPAVSPTTPLDDVAIEGAHARALAVVDGEQVVGLVRMQDIARLAAHALRKEKVG